MASTRKETAGRSSEVRASRAGSIMRAGSSLEEVQVIGHHGAPDAEDQDGDGEAEGDLGHRDADGEEREDHPHHVRVEAREGDQVDVDGIEHQLDAEEGGGEGEIGAEAHAYSSGLAK